MKKALWLIPILLVCGVCFGEEVVKVEDKGSTLISILGYSAQIIAAGFALLCGWFFKWLMAKAGEDKARLEAIEALKAGVNNAWDTVGRDLKAKAADGKLTAEEKKQLRDLAIAKAKEVVTSDGAKVLEKWGVEILVSKIKDIVDARKAKAAEAGK